PVRAVGIIVDVQDRPEVLATRRHDREISAPQPPAVVLAVHGEIDESARAPRELGEVDRRPVAVVPLLADLRPGHARPGEPPRVARGRVVPPEVVERLDELAALVVDLL